MNTLNLITLGLLCLWLCAESDHHVSVPCLEKGMNC